jgi:SAM-dependent methyltransferase
METRIVPLDLLFCQPSQILLKLGVSKPIPIVFQYPHMEFIQCIVGGDARSLEILEREYQAQDLECGDSPRSYVKGIRIKSLFARLGMLSQCPMVTMLDRDRLLVTEGVDICYVSKALGRTWVRVKMSREAARSWDGRSTARLDSVVRTSMRRRFYNPIFHERYKAAEVSRPESTRLDRMNLLLGGGQEGLRGLDIGCNMGHTSYHLERLGFRMTGVDFDREHLEIATSLKETYGLNPTFIESNFGEFSEEVQYDVVVAQTILYHLFFRQPELDAAWVAKKVGSLTGGALIWESGDQPEREKEIVLKHSGLTQYLYLGKTQGTGINTREFGCFLRDGSEIGREFERYYNLRLASDSGRRIFLGE